MTGHELKSILDRAGYSPLEFADSMQKSVVTIQNWLSGLVPIPFLAATWANTLLEAGPRTDMGVTLVIGEVALD